jgi:hypothetical protein
LPNFPADPWIFACNDDITVILLLSVTFTLTSLTSLLSHPILLSFLIKFLTEKYRLSAIYLPRCQIGLSVPSGLMNRSVVFSLSADPKETMGRGMQERSSCPGILAQGTLLKKKENFLIYV